MKEKYISEIKGILVFALGIIILASFISFTPEDLAFYTSSPNVPAKNLIRGFGAYLAGFLLLLFGWPAYLIPLAVIWQGITLFRQHNPDLRVPRVVGLLFFLISASSISAMVGEAATELIQFSSGGVIGFLLSNFLITYFGRLGSYIIFITFAVLSFTLFTQVLLSSTVLSLAKRGKALFRNLFGFIRMPAFLSRLFNRKKKTADISPRPSVKNNNLPKPQAAQPLVSESKVATAKPKIQIRTAQEAPAVKVKPRQVQIGDYRLPSLELLESPPPLAERQIKDDLAANARVLEETLADFGISAKVTDIERGPVITRYELEPAPGVKLNKIVALGDDIALTMKAQSVRIVAPIPGKGRVGVEVPNMQSSLVYLKEVFESPEFQKNDSNLTLALGKDITGKPVVTDLSGMPHLLIAGATGSGKTVCVNSLILSMLFRAHPNEVKFLMVDPKMVELAPFNGLPHLLCPVVTDVKKVSAALNWVVNEMEERYRLLANVGVRNIEAYNQKEQEKLPYIVVIIDELADLMVIARDSIESAITRLAQLSRAVGIHLILATQRPSVDVITGVIKANFPARISFKVASKVDSRTVLDMNGADKLLGRGDLLFLRPGESKLIRAQGSLVYDREIDKVVEFIRSQAEPEYNEEILKTEAKSLMLEGGKDDLYEEAVRIIIESGQASVSILQRRLRLGYTRAARIIDMMEQEGLIGPFEGSKPRQILVDRQEWLKERITEGSQS